MFILNILENGVEGIKLEYPKSTYKNIKEYYINNESINTK